MSCSFDVHISLRLSSRSIVQLHLISSMLIWNGSDGGASKAESSSVAGSRPSLGDAWRGRVKKKKKCCCRMWLYRDSTSISRGNHQLHICSRPLPSNLFLHFSLFLISCWSPQSVTAWIMYSLWEWVLQGTTVYVWAAVLKDRDLTVFGRIWFHMVEKSKATEEGHHRH